MGDIVNLRMARKARHRSDADALADANRASHGRTKAERMAQNDREKRFDRHLDGAKRETD